MVIWIIFFDFQDSYGKIWSSSKALKTCRMILTPEDWVWDQYRGCPVPRQLATQKAAQRELLKEGSWCPTLPSHCGATS